MSALQEPDYIIVSHPLTLADVADRDQLIHANINPDTGLATDYLNLFNEIIMLLEMLADFPDCLIDVLEWTPCSYAEHFQRTNFKEKDLAIAAYEAAPFEIKCEIDALFEAMNAILVSAINGLRLDLGPDITIELASETAARIKPMIAQASGIINGTEPVGSGDVSQSLQAAQAAIDAVLERI